MAAEFLSGLSFAARMAMPFIEPLAMEGIGANEILRRYMGARTSVLAHVRRATPELLSAYTKQFGRLRRQEGLALIRHFKQGIKPRAYALHLRRDALPDVNRVQLGKLGMSDSYAYTFKALGRLRDGTRVERWVTVTSSRLVPWGHLEDDAAGYFEGVDPSGGLVEYSFTHQEILRRPVFSPV